MLKHLFRWALLVLIIGCCTLWASTAAAEQASSQVRSLQGGYLDAGGEHTCAVLGDASVRCWGLGTGGRLGYGSDADVENPAAAGPVTIAGGQPRAIAAGLFHTCAIVQDGSTRCWGFDADGRLGNGDTKNVPENISDAAAARPIDFGPGRRAKAITAGLSHTCALLDDATVRCWGRGIDGRLGSGAKQSIGDDETPGSQPPVALGRPAIAVAAGDFHTCAVLDNGDVRCWGLGEDGRLGLGDTQNVGDDEAPVSRPPVALGRPARAVTAGSRHTCALLDDGSVRCWGLGVDGQLGTGSTATSRTPAAPVRLGARAIAVAAAAGYLNSSANHVRGAHTCAILESGALRCWGFNGNGELGIAQPGLLGDDEHPDSVAPVALGPGVQARAVTAGAAHTCALLSNSTVRCWGFNGDGRLGTDAPDGTVSLGGAAPGAVAATTLALSPDTARVQSGGTVNLQVAIGNAGIDPADIRLAVETSPGLAIEAADPARGTYDAATGTWRPGPLDASGRATLALRARAQGTGNAVLTAEVVSTSAFNPNTPNGGVGALAQAVVAITAPPAPAPPPVTTDGTQSPPVSVAPARIRGISATFVRTPRAGVSRRLTVSGVVRLPVGADATACAGTVRVRVTAGKRLVSSRNAALRGTATACRYSAVLPLPKAKVKAAKRVQLRVRFMGTPTLLARDAKVANLLVKAPPLPRSVTTKVRRTASASRASTFALSGAVVLPRGVPRAACAGTVRVRATVGSKTAATRTVRVKRVKSSCRYTARLSVPKAKVAPAKRVVMRVGYLGTPRLQARDAKAVAVRM